MVDNAVVFVAEKYGLGREEDVLKNEVRTLQYEYMVEKTKNMDDTLGEVKQLQQEVKKLTEEKVYLLEKEIQRLEHENKQYKLLGNNGVPQLEGSSFSLDQIQRFSFKDDYIKCIFKNNLTNVYPLKEEELLQCLTNTFNNITINLQNEQLHITYLDEGYKSKSFNLNGFVSVEELEKIEQISYLAKRTIY